MRFVSAPVPYPKLTVVLSGSRIAVTRRLTTVSVVTRVIPPIGGAVTLWSFVVQSVGLA